LRFFTCFNIRKIIFYLGTESVGDLVDAVALELHMEMGVKARTPKKRSDQGSGGTTTVRGGEAVVLIQVTEIELIGDAAGRAGVNPAKAPSAEICIGVSKNAIFSRIRPGKRLTVELG
jgi:hypothetical protein